MTATRRISKYMTPLIFRPDRDRLDRSTARTTTSIAIVNRSPAESGPLAGLWQWDVRRLADDTRIAGGFDNSEDNAKWSCGWEATP